MDTAYKYNCMINIHNIYYIYIYHMNSYDNNEAIDLLIHDGDMSVLKQARHGSKKRAVSR